MKVYNCWPYEELQVEWGESPHSFRFSTPWHSSEVQMTPSGGELAGQIFSTEESDALSASERIQAYRRVLSPLVGEPFSYILPPMEETRESAGSDSHSMKLQASDFVSPARLAKALNLPDLKIWEAPWSWDLDAALELSRMPMGFHYGLSLFSVFRRFFYLEALEQDQTRRLYDEASSLLGPGRAPSALAYLIAQNLHVTERCERVLSQALPLAGDAEHQLMDFMESERGHDRIMAKALEGFPPGAVESWALKPHPHTRLLMDSFEALARHNFLAFALTVSLFERPHAEKLHPLTALLQQEGLHEAASRYERHHQINEDGDHDNIGLELIERIPPLSPQAAREAGFLSELMCRVLVTHSQALMDEMGGLSQEEK